MWTNENLLTYNKRFGLHTINALAGHSIIGYDEEGLTASKQGFPTNNIYELDGGTKNPNTGGNAGAYRLQSFLDVYSTIMTTNISSNSMFDMMDLHACQNHTAMQHFLLYH